MTPQLRGQASKQASSQTVLATGVDKAGLAGLAGTVGAPGDNVTGPPGLVVVVLQLSGRNRGSGNIKP